MPLRLIDTGAFLRRVGRSRLLWGFLFLLIVFTFFFIREWNRIQNIEMTSWAQAVSADCGVVLTGGPGRIREGFALLENSSIKKLVISGVHLQSQLRDIFPMWAFYSHARESDVVLEKKSQTTYGNAQQSLSLVEALQCRDLVLITSRLHMYRSSKTFKAVMPESIDIRLHPVVAGSLRASFWETSIEVIKSLFYSLWAY